MGQNNFSLKYPVINHNGKEYKKECLYVYNRHFAIQQRLAQHCKSTILQLKKVKKKNKTQPFWSGEHSFQLDYMGSTKRTFT